MIRRPEPVDQFLQGKRLAVAGVSRHPEQPANAIFHKLRDSGYEVFPINPKAQEVEGETCFPDIVSLPDPIDGVVVATPPEAAAEVVRQCDAKGIRQIWFHRSFGQGSVSKEALSECRERGIRPIDGGCPMMYCEPVDIAHRCMGWCLRKMGRIPS